MARKTPPSDLLNPPTSGSTGTVIPLWGSIWKIGQNGVKLKLHANDVTPSRVWDAMPEQFDPYYHWLGIPPHEQPPNHYRLLSLQLFEPNADVIQHAVDRVMAHVRTLQSGARAAESQQLLNEIARAKVCLLDARKKAEYDGLLRAGLEAASEAQRPGAAGSGAIRQQPAPAGDPEVLEAGKPVWLYLAAPLILALVGIVVITLYWFTLSSGPAVAKRPSRDGADVPKGGRPDNAEPAKDSRDAEPGAAGTTGPEKRMTDAAGAPKDSTASVKGNGGPDATSAVGVPAPSYDTGPPDEATRQAIIRALGMVAPDFALCQQASLLEFVAISKRLRPLGYRPTRIRPYRSVAGTVQAAAIWTRDGIPWLFLQGVDSRELATTVKIQAKVGFRPIDVAGYEDGGLRYVVLLAKLPDDGSQVEWTIGLTGDEARTSSDDLNQRGFYPTTIHAFLDGSGQQRESQVWMRPPAGGRTQWTRWGRAVAADTQWFTSADVPAWPFDVTMVESTREDSPELTWIACGLRRPGACAVLSGLDAKSHLDECLKVAASGLLPASISVVDYHDQIVTASIWHGRPGDSGSPDGSLIQVAGPLPAKPKTSSAMAATPPAESAPPAAPVVKSDPPTDAVQTHARQTFTAKYATQLAAAKTPDSQTLLAKTFLAAAKQEADPPTRFVAATLALELAVRAGNVDLAFVAITQKAEEFAVDTLQEEAEALKAILTSARRNPYRFGLARIAFRLAGQARETEQFDVAVQMNSVAGNAARRARDAVLARAARAQLQRITGSRDLATQARQAERTLAQTPDDPDAHLVLGKYLCFARHEWDEGLDHLVHGSDEELAELARRDGAKPSDAQEQLALADRWAAWGKASGTETVQARRRAVRWYARAIPQLHGGLRQAARDQLIKYDDQVLAQSWRNMRDLPWTEGPPGALRHLAGHSGEVLSLAVDAAGRTVISGSTDGTVRVWDLISGTEMHQLASISKRIGSVVLTGNGRYVFGEGDSRRTALWDVKSGKLLQALPTKQRIETLAASPDGALVAWSLPTSDKNNVVIWEMERKLTRVMNCPSIAYHLAFSPDGRRLVTASSAAVDGWDLANFARRFHLDTKYPTSAMAFSPDGRRLAVGSLSDVRIVDAFSAAPLHELQAVETTRLAFLSDGTRLIRGGRRGAISVWNVETGKCLQTLDTEDAETRRAITALAPLPDPHAFLYGNDAGDITLWRLAD